MEWWWWWCCHRWGFSSGSCWELLVPCEDLNLILTVCLTSVLSAAQHAPAWIPYNPNQSPPDTQARHLKLQNSPSPQMTLLTALGLRRKNDWEPPTLLDSLLISPLHLLVTIIYSILLFLRGRPFRPPRDKPAIRVVCLSDTHDQINVRVPPGDLLIHAGDLTNAGTADDIQAQLDWLASFPHQHKILVCGNHDSFFDLSARRPEDRGKTLDFKGIRYLVHDAVTLEFKGGRRLKIYGSPDIPACGGPEMAFQYDRASPPWANTVPIDTDILITHAPPVCRLLCRSCSL